MQAANLVETPRLEAEPLKKVGYVIGNGLSRKGFDLNLLDNSVTVGCNSLYKDYDPTYLVAIDRYMKDSPVKAIERLLDDGPQKWKYVTRELLDDFWCMTIDGEKQIEEIWLNRGYCLNSGMYGALLLSQVLKYDIVYLIGIDFFRNVRDENGDLQPNDIYGGTYEGHSGLIKVWNHMFEGSPLQELTGEVDEDGHAITTVRNLIDTKFIRVGPIEDADREWYDSEFQNLEFIEDFDDMPIC